MYYLDDYKHSPNLLWENYLRRRARGMQKRYMSLGANMIFPNLYIDLEKSIYLTDGDFIEAADDSSIYLGIWELKRSTL